MGKQNSTLMGGFDCGHDFQPTTAADQVDYRIKVDQVGKMPDSNFSPTQCLSHFALEITAG